MTAFALRSFRRLLTVSLASAAALGVVPAGAESLRVHYGVSLIGLTIGSASITGTVEPTSYKVELNAKVGGVAAVLSSSHGAATAAGALTGSHPVPSSYATLSANSSMSRSIRMAMTNGTVSGVEIEPPFDPQAKRVPVSEADKRDIVDPLSAFVMVAPPGPIGPATCDRTLPVFDGAVRFDIALNYVATRHVKAKGYEGDVAVCNARYRPISGHLVDSKASKFMAENKNLEVWLAPIADTHVVFPFRINVRTMIGTVVIEADEFATTATHASTR